METDNPTKFFDALGQYCHDHTGKNFNAQTLQDHMQAYDHTLSPGAAELLIGLSQDVGQDKTDTLLNGFKTEGETYTPPPTPAELAAQKELNDLKAIYRGAQKVSVRDNAVLRATSKEEMVALMGTRVAKNKNGASAQTLAYIDQREQYNKKLYHHGHDTMSAMFRGEQSKEPELSVDAKLKQAKAFYRSQQRGLGKLGQNSVLRAKTLQEFSREVYKREQKGGASSATIAEGQKQGWIVAGEQAATEARGSAPGNGDGRGQQQKESYTGSRFGNN